MKTKETFLLLALLLFFIVLGIIAYYYHSNSFYARAYRPVVEEANERNGNGQGGAVDSQTSDEPHPYGLREREIQKEQGDRYSTY